MRLCHRAGHVVPLLTIIAVLAGCATSTTDQPPNFNANPQVVAIYAVDSATGNVLPDVLIYSSDPADTGKISTNPPPSYSSYRVEFDQPIAGESIANNTDRPSAIGGNASFCSPLTTSPVQLIDVQGDGTRPAGPVVSSVCYDATSPLGSHPHIQIVPGRAALTDPAAAPLTCNRFRPAVAFDAAGNQLNVFKPNHKYGITIKSGVVSNRAGKTLSAPTGTGWTGDTFQFTTSGFKILAAGFQDSNTGFFVWLDKPEPGFEKDLAPVPSTYQQPADSSPFLIVVSEPIDNASAVKMVRTDDGTNPDAVAQTFGFLIGDGRVIEVNTGAVAAPQAVALTGTFEPAQAYTVTVPATLTANSGDVITNAKPFSFTSADGTPSVVGTSPTNNATAVTTGNGPLGAVIQVQYSAPVAVDAGGIPTGVTTKVTGPGGDVQLASVKAHTGSNNQIIDITPAAPLTPETQYTLSVAGAKVGPSPKHLIGQPFPTATVVFTTATFRMNRIQDGSTNPANGAIINLDRRTDVEPRDLTNGALRVDFLRSASNVTPATLVLSEINAAGAATKVPSYTVTPVSAANAGFLLKATGGYQIKYGQKYEVRALTTITDTATGKALKAEGCTLPANQCDDVKSFTTRQVNGVATADTTTPGITIASHTTSGVVDGYTISFNLDPIQASSVTPFLATEFKLFRRDAATGALDPNSLPLTCKTNAAAGGVGVGSIDCTTTTPLQPFPTTYLASAVFSNPATATSGPARVDPSVSTDPSAQFSGSLTATIVGSCP